MGYKLIITTTAELNTVDACNYYENQQTGLSERFLEELYTAYEKISSNPQHFSYISANPNDKLRDITLNKFPFVVIYEVSGNNVVLIAVFNTHRAPLY